MSFILNALAGYRPTCENRCPQIRSTRWAFQLFQVHLAFLCAWAIPFSSQAAAQLVQRSVASDGVAFDIPVTAVCYPLPENLEVRPAGQVAAELIPVSTARTQLISNANLNQQTATQPFAANTSAAGDSGRRYAARPTLAQQYQVNAATRRQRYLLPIDATVVFSDPEMVDTVIFEVFPLSRTWKIGDYAPRSISTTDYAGPISEEVKENSDHGISGDLKGGIPGYADLSLKLNGNNNQNKLVRQTIKPPHTQIVTSGLTQRGTGAFFKFHRSSEFAIEGGHQLELLLEVDSQWRGDVVQVHCRAVDRSGNMFTKDFLMAVTIDGDWEAAEVASQFAEADRGFQSVLRRWQVKRRPQNIFSGISDALANDKQPDKPDSKTLGRLILVTNAIHQIPGADRLPGTVQNSVANMLEAKSQMLHLAR